MAYVGNRHFSSSEITWLKLAAPDASNSRTHLATELCKKSNWRNSSGELCLDQARAALPVLCDRLGIQLAPSNRPSHPNGYDWSAGREKFRLVSSSQRIQHSFDDLGKITFNKASGKVDNKIWKEFLDKNHYLGCGGHGQGKRIKYLVYSENIGLIGAISFRAASQHVKDRDHHIGWNRRQRSQDGWLDKVLNNDRFAVRNDIKVPGLSSYILKSSLDLIAQDWKKKHKIPALAVYTYVGSEDQGDSYTHAGWKHIGETSGRYAKDESKKKIFFKAIDPNYKEHLCKTLYKNPFLMPNGMNHDDVFIHEHEHFSELEYRFSDYPEGRIKKCIAFVGGIWCRRPYGPISQKFPAEKDRRRAYSLIRNTEVTVDDILSSHRRCTAMRCTLEKEVLILQDTTMLNFDTLKKSTKGLSKIGHAQGLAAHASIAVTTDGKILGCVRLDGEYRERYKQENNKEENKSNKIRQSHRWKESLETTIELNEATPGTKYINVADREGDIWSNLEFQHANKDKFDLLVRSCTGRERFVIKQDGTEELLHDYMRNQPSLGNYEAVLQAHGGDKPHNEIKIEVSVSMAHVKLKGPKKYKHNETLDVTVVRAHSKEKLPESEGEGKKETALKRSTTKSTTHDKYEDKEWVLIFTGKRDITEKDAKDILDYYVKRWKIEELFRTLKTCAEIERYKFSDSSFLMKSMAFDVVNACYVTSMLETARNNSDAPWSQVCSAEDLNALVAVAKACRLDDSIPQKLLKHAVNQLNGTAAEEPANSKAVPSRQEESPSPTPDEAQETTESGDEDVDNSESQKIIDTTQSSPKVSAREIVILIGRIGGFIPTKQQELPGYKTMWRGYKELRISSGVVLAVIELQQKVGPTRAPP